MTTQDIVVMLDKKYSGAEGRVACPNEGRMAVLPQSGARSTEHGALGVHASGAKLVCGMCGHEEAIGSPA